MVKQTQFKPGRERGVKRRARGKRRKLSQSEVGVTNTLILQGCLTAAGEFLPSFQVSHAVGETTRIFSWK